MEPLYAARLTARHGSEPPTALTVYDRLGMLLATDLGTEPGRDLHILQLAVLRQDEAVLTSPQPGQMALAA